jgi:hypothetical protein
LGFQLPARLGDQGAVDAQGLGQLTVVERRPLGGQVLDDALSQR